MIISLPETIPNPGDPRIKQYLQNKKHLINKGKPAGKSFRGLIEHLALQNLSLISEFYTEKNNS